MSESSEISSADLDGAETNEEKVAPEKYTKRELFNKIAKKAVVEVPPLVAGHGVGQVAAQTEARKIGQYEALLGERFPGLEINIILSDHLPPVNSDNSEILTGEINRGNLDVSPEEKFENAPEQSIWVNGRELLGRDRLRQFQEAITGAKLVINTDGTSLTTNEYWDIVKDDDGRRLLLSYGAGTVGGFLAVSALARVFSKGPQGKETGDKGMDRRSFLRTVLGGLAAGFLTRKIRLGIQRSDSGTDLSSLNEAVLELAEVLPFQESVVESRNKIMAVNINSLAALSLKNVSGKLDIFAGGGHVGMLDEISKDPTVLENELQTQMKAQLVGLLSASRKHEGNADKQRLIAAYSGFGLGRLYRPVEMRLNRVAEDGAPQEEFVTAANETIAQVNQPSGAEAHKSVAVLFIEALAEVSGQAQTDSEKEFLEEFAQSLYRWWQPFGKTIASPEFNNLVMSPRPTGGIETTISTSGIEVIQQGGFVKNVDLRSA